MAVLTCLFEQPVRGWGPGHHPTAVVAEDAIIGEGVELGPYVVVGTGASIGAGCRLLSHVTIGAGAMIGPGGLIHPGVRVGDRVRIGARVIIQPNAVIGSDGFSFVTPERGSVETAKETGRVEAANLTLRRINSLGTVEIGDDVEIGAGATIDRGTVAATTIGSHTKIDNLVQIGHNVRIGSHSMLCGHVGIAGSSVIGDRVVLAGKVGVADHVTIGDDAVIAAGSGVGSTVPAKAVMMGFPAVPRERALEQLLHVNRLKSLFADIVNLKERLKAVEKPGKID
jgi:UDP-3-O-[3-hydroxymyristoyl] glucosamine N-acyltransferase